LLVVELGGNDLLRGQRVHGTEANLRGIVRGAKAKGVEVVLLGITAPVTHGPDYKAAFDALYRTIAEEEQVRLVPGFVDELMGKADLLQSDGLHPTKEGHALLAGALTPVLGELVRGEAEAP